MLIKISMKFSIVIPAHNESENLKILLPQLKTALQSIEHEVVIVDNASTDDSGEILRAFQTKMPELIVVKEPTLGYGRAVIAGLKNAKGDVIGIIRSDNQEKPEDLVKMYEDFHNSGFDLYKAIRKHRIRDGLMRVIISKIYNLLFRFLFHTKIKDINACPKILKRELHEKLNIESNDSFIDSEIIIKTLGLGYKIGETKIDYLPRLRGKSTVKPATVYEFLKNMLTWRNRIKNEKFLAK